MDVQMMEAKEIAIVHAFMQFVILNDRRE